MNVVRVLLIFCVIGLAGCTKDKVIKMAPHPYFPAYPGSYWEYETETNQIVIKRVEDGYHGLEYLEDCSAGGASSNDKRNIIGRYAVPKYDGLYVFGHILGEQKVCKEHEYLMFPEDVEGASLQGFYYRRIGGYGYGTRTSRKLVFKDTTVEVKSVPYNRVIGVSESSYNFDYILIHKMLQYYSKGIGLIYQLRIDYDFYTGMHDTSTLELVTYQINNQ